MTFHFDEYSRKLTCPLKEGHYQRGKQFSNQPFSGATVVLGGFKGVSINLEIHWFSLCLLFMSPRFTCSNQKSSFGRQGDQKKKDAVFFFICLVDARKKKNNPPSMVVWWWLTFVEFERKHIQDCDVLDRHLSSDFPGCGRNPAPPDVFLNKQSSVWEKNHEQRRSCSW